MEDGNIDVMKAMQSCRCCLLRPPEKGLKTLYSHLGKTEIYYDMLKDCLNIHLALGDNECGICEICVSRLRDANDFKYQVQRSQALLETALRANDQQPSIKLERPSSPDMSLDGTLQCAVENLGRLEVIFESIDSSQLPTSESVSANMKTSHAWQTGPDTFDGDPHTTEMRVRDKQETEGKQETQDDAIPPGMFQCDTCEALFKMKTSLDKHIEANHKDNKEDKKHPCNICQKMFSNKTHLKYHMQTHMGSERPRFTCELCPTHFFHKTSFKKHIQMHKEGKQYYSCDVCDKQLASKATLNAHKRIHTGERAYPKKPKTFSKKTIFCEVCGKGFPSNSSFSLHMNVHNGVKPYSCNICHEQFTQKGSLKGHMHIHTGDKPYSCDICHKRFGLKSGLKNHMIVHKSEKGYSCEICNKQFKYRAALVTHVKLIHSGQKPHACNVCGKAFALLSSLKRHALIHTGERPYVCDTCEKGFITKTKLKSHLLIHARDTR